MGEQGQGGSAGVEYEGSTNGAQTLTAAGTGAPESGCESGSGSGLGLHNVPAGGVGAGRQVKRSSTLQQRQQGRSGAEGGSGAAGDGGRSGTVAGAGAGGGRSGSSGGVVVPLPVALRGPCSRRLPPLPRRMDTREAQAS